MNQRGESTRSKRKRQLALKPYETTMEGPRPIFSAYAIAKRVWERERRRPRPWVEMVYGGSLLGRVK